jgi:hypothetical protein
LAKIAAVTGKPAHGAAARVNPGNHILDRYAPAAIAWFHRFHAQFEYGTARPESRSTPLLKLAKLGFITKMRG